MITTRLRLPLIAAALLTVTLAGPAHAEPPVARAFLNGVPSPVFFNDGDSFRALAGTHQGAQGRLAGFNTLESFGPAHMWGTWTMKELAHYAKKATVNGRKGTWNCESDLNRDGYGRLLWWCKDLALDQVRKGYAHAMSVTEAPADPDLLAVQAEAITARRGIWAHGVPDYVLTSLHSTSEGYPDPYNRLVSTKDGSSKKWLHQQNYPECSLPCTPSEDADDAAIAALAKALIGTPPFAQMTELTLIEHIKAHVTTGMFGEVPQGADRFAIENAVARAIASGELRISKKPVACMLYVDFTRRYGAKRASCLNK
ncbi:MAG: thermonuclease family protein [Myxococcales bacterium]|nr:thermonuclease family protein [Myxococcales bacterium]